MIFQHTWQQVLDGSKTHLRRLVKPGDRLFDDTISLGISPDHPLYIPTRVGAWMKHPKEFPFRLKYECGRTYAVQPGRTEKGIARIRITGIRRERVQDITEADAEAEGCEPLPCDYCGGYGWREDVGMDEDPENPGYPIPVLIQVQCSACGGYGQYAPASYMFEGLWNDIHTAPGTTWADNPEVWVLEFEIARAADDTAAPDAEE